MRNLFREMEKACLAKEPQDHYPVIKGNQSSLHGMN